MAVSTKIISENATFRGIRSMWHLLEKNLQNFEHTVTVTVCSFDKSVLKKSATSNVLHMKSFSQ